MKMLLLGCSIIMGIVASAQSDSTNVKTNDEKPKKWYDSFSIKGYAQSRYHGLLQTNPDLGCEQCDKNWGGDGGFSMRRIRLVLSGQIGPRVYYYIQNEFAGGAGTSALHIAQIRDAYFDVGLDKRNEFRFRFGQSKVPFGFENLQSSQNRLAVDRSDAINSAAWNEREIGVFFYWAPEKKRKMLTDLVKEGLKGTGDYGIFGCGIYNGQGSNLSDLNGNLHGAARLTWPFQIKNQIFEAGIQGYAGMWTMDPGKLSAGVKYKSDLTYDDRRLGASFTWYAKPFGIQADYNIGVSPEFNKNTDSIETQPLKGGYVVASYQAKLGKQLLIPFVRYQTYDGAKRFEKDARSYDIKELEFGFEWQPFKQIEFVVVYVMSERRYEDFSKQSNYQRGNILRVQVQVNY